MPDSRFKFEIDNIDVNSWERLMNQFEDASLYQTWAFAGSPTRTRNISHIVIKAGEEIIASCQLRLKHIPFINIGVADINWGPLCNRKGRLFESEALVYIMRKIKEEYGIKQGYLLRIMPHATGERKQILKELLENEGFRCNIADIPYRTFRIELSPPLGELRLNLLQKWRNCLNKAEKNNLKVREGTSDDLFKIFIRLADEMCKRKKFTIGVDYHQYRRIQENLPPHLKMRIMVCEANGESVGVIICSAIGNTGVYLLGATGQEGLKLNCSYLLQWRMIQWMKENGIQYYDLGAFNPQSNPGVYHFKQGLAGKKECEEVFLNEYIGRFNLRGHIANIVTIRRAIIARVEVLKRRFARKALNNWACPKVT